MLWSALVLGVLLGQQPPPSSYAPIQDTPGLPRVLLIGDSISVGYTLPTRALLKGKANVHRVPVNAAHSRSSVEKLESWLGSGRWDVIHCNWGLHDLKIMDDGKHQVAPDEYQRNLDRIVSRLKETGAKVVFATTTPVPDGDVSPKRVPADVIRFNEVAVRVMAKHGIPVNDLYAEVLPKLSKLQRPVNVHFTDEGSQFLAEKVAAAITRALAKPPHETFRWVNPLPAGAKVKHATYFSKLHQTEVGYAIYLPPDYNNSNKRYPVVYYLHGGRPGGENKSVRMADIFDKHIRAGTVSPMIYVFVNGGAVSHYDYPALKSFGESTFIEELIPHIDKSYRTIANKRGRGLEGFSQGGRGTARIAFRHPELFCSAAPMGGGHQHEKRAAENGGREGTEDGYTFAAGYNTWDLAKQYAAGKQKTKLLVVVGTKDFNYQANLAWMEHLLSLGISFEKIVVPDVPHNAAQVYEKIGVAAMEFHQTCFGR